jgi:aspartokinase
LELALSLDVSKDENCAIVSLVGTEVGGAPLVAARTTRTIGDVPILLASYGASETSVSLAVSEKDAHEVLAALHEEFFGEGLPDGVLTRSGEEVDP